MEKLTVLETIDKIEKLIDENSGDIGRLEHIVDFLKKEKPLYNTDRIYLESKINGEIIGFLNALLPSKDYKSEHYKWFNDRYESFIYVDRIIFNKSYQNQGYGTVFYDDLINSGYLKKI